MRHHQTASLSHAYSGLSPVRRTSQSVDYLVRRTSQSVVVSVKDRVGCQPPNTVIASKLIFGWHALIRWSSVKAEEHNLLGGNCRKHCDVQCDSTRMLAHIGWHLYGSNCLSMVMQEILRFDGACPHRTAIAREHANAMRSPSRRGLIPVG